MPTRNRAHLLRFALQSAVEQTFEDYEIVVSDNCSTDDTDQVVRESKDARVRYVRSLESLSMPDSWEFAVRHAKGRYVTFLCDDDAISPQLLEMLVEITQLWNAEVITWGHGGYNHPNWYIAEDRNVATLPRLSNTSVRVNSRPALARLFSELWPSFPVPKMLQSCCSRRVLESIWNRAGRLFIPSCPDLSSPTFILDAVGSYVHIDQALMISGAARESNGAAQFVADNRAVLRAFADEFEPDGLFQETPLHALVSINCVADTLLRSKRLLGDRLHGIDINWERYYAMCFEGLGIYRQANVDTATEFEEFYAVMACQPEEFQQRVWKHIDAQRPVRWRQAIRRAINSNRFLTSFESLVRPAIRNSKGVRILGAQAGFTNILECVRMLPEFGRRYTSARFGSSVPEELLFP